MGNVYESIISGLKEAIEESLADDAMNMPVVVDSYIVFSTPKELRIRVTDNYHQEKWCFRTGINLRIDNYHGNVMYSDSQLEQISKRISELESNKKRFQLTIDFDMVRRDFANAITVLELVDSYAQEDCHNATKHITNEKEHQRVNTISREKIKKNLQKVAQLQLAGSIASCIVVGSIAAIASGGAVFRR